MPFEKFELTQRPDRRLRTASARWRMFRLISKIGAAINSQVHHADHLPSTLKPQMRMMIYQDDRS